MTTKRSASSRSAARATVSAKSTKSTTSEKWATAAELDQMFDAGADMTPYIDTAHATRPGRTVQRVNVDFPVDLLRQIDAEADRIGVTRQAFIKLRIADAVRQTNESFTNRTVVHDEIEEHAKHLEPDAQARFVRLREICRKAKIGKES